MRRDKKLKNAKTVAELKKENEDLKSAANKHDDELTEVDLQLVELKQQLSSTAAKVKNLEAEKEKDYIENDDWVAKVFTNMSSEGRKEFRNAS